MVTLTIHGRPVSKKNSRPIHVINGRPFIGNSKSYRVWHKQAVTELLAQRSECFTGNQKLHADVRVYLAKGQTMDIDNALGGPFDALEAAGIVRNDHQIASATVKRSRDRENPRVEIDLCLRESRI